MKLYEPFQFLTDSECREILDYANQNITKNAENPVRQNRIVWYEDSKYWKKWIDMLNSIEPVIDWIQTPQISFYRPGEQYGWHNDGWPLYRTHIRHFTLTCELQSAPGASFQMAEHDIPSLRVGEAVIFRSPERHQATSPSKGERISFTIWAMTKNPNQQPFPNQQR